MARFTELELEQARNYSTLDIISKRTGFSFKREGSEYKCVEHDSLVVFSDCKGWQWYSCTKNGKDLKGNNAIAYLMKVEGLTFRQAVCEIIQPNCYKPSEEKALEKPKSLILPPKSANNDKIINYLCHERCISPIVVKSFIQKGLIYQDEHNNVVFVGRDTDGTAKYACKRGTYTAPEHAPYKRECAGSSKMFGFIQEGNFKEQIFVFEAPIDLLSHATLTMEKARKLGKSDWSVSWGNYSRLALGGVADKALERYLIVYPQVNTISFCFDNDETGRSFAYSYKEKYEKEGYNVNIYNAPTGKDYNEYLQAYARAKLQATKSYALNKRSMNNNGGL